MLTSLHIQRYGCVHDATLALTPLHAVVGPNDSGKSTLLEAVGSFWNWFVLGDTKQRVESVWSRATVETELVGELLTPSLSGSVEIRSGVFGTGPFGRGEGESWSSTDAGDTNPFGRVRTDWEGRSALSVRLEADLLKEASGLFTPENSLTYGMGRGVGLPGALDAILGRGDGTYGRIQDEIRRLFPTVKNIRLEAVTGSKKRVAFNIVGQPSSVGAKYASEGLLYFLAYLTMRESTNAAILLVEEPENGLHPARIKDVVQVLREISESGTQVIMATHSPLVLNELHADEISVVTRDPATGTHVTPLAGTPNFQARSEVYAFGELWLSYCDGDMEGPLLGGARSHG